MTYWDDANDLDAFFGRSPGPSAGPRSGGSGTGLGTGASGRTPARSRRIAPRRAALPIATGPRAVRSGVREPRPRGHKAAPLDGPAIRRRTLRRLTAFMLAVTLLVVGVVVRLVDISRDGGLTCRTAEVVDCKSYGIAQRTAFRPLPAGRGAVLDRNGQAFALSVPEPNVVADPRAIAAMEIDGVAGGGPAAVAKALAPILGVSEADLRGKLADHTSRYTVLAPTVPADKVDQVKQAIDGAGLVGISFEDQFVRKTPSEGLARAVIGQTYQRGLVDDQGRQGQTGVELAYDHRLEGTAGKLSFEKDRDGGTIAGTREKVQAAVPGTDLYLTLDQSLQYAAEQAVIDQVTTTGARQGMAIISRPSTGEVLAMVNVADDGTGKVVNTADNRSVSTMFEPGSVNKMITIAGAIEDGLVRPDTVLDVPDHLQVADHRFTDHDPHAVEPWSVTDILVTSSNIGTIKVAQQLGKDRIDHYLRSFGFGQATSSEFPAEVRGLMLPTENWSGTSIGSIPIGQGISVTALQMLAAYNVVANDGVAVAPRLVAATDDGSGRVAAPASPRRRVLSSGTAQAMTAMLTKVVSDGTGQSAQVPGYPAAGKTGTARIPQPAPHKNPADAYQDADGKYHYESSFVGFVAGADLSIIVTIQDAETSIYGSEVAAPVFARLAALGLRSESIPPPALVDAQAHAVPDLSASARQLGDEGPARTARSTPG